MFEKLLKKIWRKVVPGKGAMASKVLHPTFFGKISRSEADKALKAVKKQLARQKELKEKWARLNGYSGAIIIDDPYEECDAERAHIKAQEFFREHFPDKF